MGVIAFELITGKLPFNDETPEKVFNKIKQRDFVMPKVGEEEGQISEAAKDFIDRLLDLNPKTRLGSKGF